MKLWLNDMLSHPLREDDWVIARSVNQAIEIMETQDITFASLDYNMGDWASEGGNGIAFVNWMIKNKCWPTEGIEVHSNSLVGAEEMLTLINANAPYTGNRRPWGSNGKPQYFYILFNRLPHFAIRFLPTFSFSC